MGASAVVKSREVQAEDEKIYSKICMVVVLQHGNFTACSDNKAE